jgi:predicted DNA-binding ArsR family transcriptional regulator
METLELTAITFMSDDELTKLRDEWRTRLSTDIASLKALTEKIQQDIHSIRESFARSKAVEELDGRVRGLELFRANLFGMFIASQVIGGIIVAVIGWVIRK